jgi:hypothetical protein
MGLVSIASKPAASVYSRISLMLEPMLFDYSKPPPSHLFKAEIAEQ